MKWILILLIAFLTSCSSDSSKDDTATLSLDDAPEGLRGFWQKSCDTEGYDQGSLLTTHKSSILFKENTAVFIYEVYDADECAGNINARSIDEFPFRIDVVVITETGLEATVVNANNYETAVMFEYSYHQSGDQLYIGGTLDLDNPFNFDDPYYR